MTRYLVEQLHEGGWIPLTYDDGVNPKKLLAYQSRHLAEYVVRIERRVCRVVPVEAEET